MRLVAFYILISFLLFLYAVVQEPVGTVDIKTKTVHFWYVQRNSNFGTQNATIPFELAPLNEGDAFDLSSGIFTVPVKGIYHFDFSAGKHYSFTHLQIYLQVNGFIIGSAFAYEIATRNFGVVFLRASFQLAAGDRVNLYKFGEGVLYDSNAHYTHFSGWLVEEDLM